MLAGYNDLASAAAPELLAEWDWEKNGELRPESVTPCSRKNVWWRHTATRGEKTSVHSWQAAPADRIRGRGCSICAGKQILPGDNDLATTHPHLLTEWDWEQNPMAPTEISYGYDKKVWWRHTVQDPQGRQWLHSWQASPNSRTNRSSGCPYCANKKVLPGYNDLATAFPELAARWDQTRNGGLTARDVTPASSRRVYWPTERGHERSATEPNTCDSNRWSGALTFLGEFPKMESE